MRFFVVVLFLFPALVLHAQDAATDAMQATQMAQQANQQAMQDAQQANQTAIQNAQTASQLNGYESVAKPRFSIASGSYPSPVTLRLKDSTRSTVIYYTIDGWTPTQKSHRYAGPVTIASTTTIQAIAVTATNARSAVVSATYTIAGSKAKTLSTSFPATASGTAVLQPGTPLPLTFTASVSSQNVEVGDTLPIALAQDITIDGVLVASKSTPVLATVTQVDKKSKFGLPGVLTFEVHSLTLKDGTTVLLSGTRTKEGQSHIGAAQGASLFPLGGLFVHGQEAVIPAGATFTAHVAADTQYQTAVSGNDVATAQ